MPNPFTLFRKFGEKFVSQYQEQNYGQDMSRRYGPDWRGVLAGQEESRRFDQAKTRADIGKSFQTQRKTAAEATKIEATNLEQIIAREAEAYGSPEVFGLDPEDEGYESRYKFVREAAGERVRQREHDESLETANLQVSEGNLGIRRFEAALKAGSPELLTELGMDRKGIESIVKRQNVSDKTALADLHNKDVEGMLDNVRLKREQVEYDYGMSLDSDEERAAFFRKEKPDEDEKVFNASTWDRLAESYADQLAIENGHVDAATGFPAPTPGDQNEGIRMAAESAREVERSGASSAVKHGEPSPIDMFRRPGQALYDPLRGEDRSDRSNPEGIMSAGNVSAQPSRQRSLGEHGGVTAEESFRDVPHGQLDESVISAIEDIVNQGKPIPKWAEDYLASIQEK